MNRENSFYERTVQRLENPTEDDKKLKAFSELLDTYNPDLRKIIEINQFDGKEDYESEKYKIKKFCENMKDFRNNIFDLSLRKFGDMCSLSHQYISDIEKEKIKSLPVDKLEFIADKLSTSPAYLIGLTDNRFYMPTKVDLYFWQFPNSPYREIEELARDVLGEKARYRMIAKFPTPVEKFRNELMTLIDENPTLAETIYALLSAPARKRYRYLRILEELKNL